MSLIAHPTSGANSYVSNSDADAYFADLLNATAWTGATEPNQDAALVTATRWLDRLIWGGSQTVDGQDLQFPRTGLFERDGTAITTTTIPGAITLATYELAFALLGGTADASGKSAKVQSVTSDGVAVTFVGGVTVAGSEIGLPKTVYSLIGYLLSGRQVASTTGAPVAYGSTDSEGDEIESEFEELNKWDRTNPI